MPRDEKGNVTFTFTAPDVLIENLMATGEKLQSLGREQDAPEAIMRGQQCQEAAIHIRMYVAALVGISQETGVCGMFDLTQTAIAPNNQYRHKDALRLAGLTTKEGNTP